MTRITSFFAVKSYTFFLLLVVIVSPSAVWKSVAQNAGLTTPASAPVELLEFLDGSTLHGRLQSIDAARGLIWEHAEATQPIGFTPENLAWLRFPRAEKIVSTNSGPNCEFHFSNGDEFFGQLVAIDQNELELQTWFAGRFKTPRAAVSSIRFFPKGGGVIYEGPTGMEGWISGRNPNTQPWQYRDGAFLGNSPSSLGRDLKLPDASRVEFDLSWTAPFNLLFSFYTGVLDGFNYNTSSYMFFISPGNVSLQRISTNTGSTTLGRSETITSLLTKKKAHFEFRGNKRENFLELLVDGKSVNQWKDNGGWVGNGSGILFYTQTDAAGVAISNIKVSDWDGGPRPEAMTNSAGLEDEIFLTNSDKVSGKLNSVKNGTVKFTTPSHALEIPSQRITQINLGNGTTNAALQSPWEVQASVFGGGTISFALEKWTGSNVVGQNQNFGKISLTTQSVRQLKFNPAKTKTVVSSSVDNILWEGDEP